MGGRVAPRPAEMEVAAAQLVLLRHGKSVWNEQNRFTGWVDSPLADAGKTEAKKAAQTLQAAGFRPAAAYASCLRRAIATLWIVLEEMELMWIPQRTDWRFNERHYGGLQGLNKAETAKEYGEEQVRQWRRGYAVSPPPMKELPPPLPAAPGVAVPNGENLREVEKRISAAFGDHIAPRLQRGENVLLVSHGNALRALIKHLENADEDDIMKLELPTAQPVMYNFGKDGVLRPPTRP